MTTGVLVMAYGTPGGRDDVEAYYTHIRRGRPPTPELLADLRRRYDAIGGVSPLLEITRRQVAATARALGDGFVIELGMKHAPPFIEDGLAALVAAGAHRVVGLVLAPHYSRLSVGEYVERVRAAAPPDLDLSFVESWHLMPAYLDFLAGQLSPDDEVVFTAHSLPRRILDEHDPYPGQLQETAQAVAGRAGLGRWSIAWQSAGRTEEPWLGPDLSTVIRELRRDLVVCPAGFVSDHLEILYDLDLDARAVADEVGIVLRRTDLPNDDPAVCAGLAELVRTHAG